MKLLQVFLIFFVFQSQAFGQGYCIAVRGNADRALAHYSALGRMIENYGIPEGMAGSSSASLAMMVVESAMLNPATQQCGDRSCTPEQRQMRVAFLVKSVAWLMEDFWRSQAGFHLQQARAYSLNHYKSHDVFASFHMIRHLKGMFRSPLLRGVVNTEWFRLKNFWLRPSHHLREFFRGLEKLNDFSVWDDTVFVRPGLVDWEQVVSNLTVYLDFLAGYDMDGDQQKAVAKAIELCSEDSFGQHWYGMSSKEVVPSKVTCGDLWADAWEQWKKTSSLKRHRRIDDDVGMVLPTYVGVGYLPGKKHVKSLKYAVRRFRKGKPYHFSGNFEDLKVGYWGPAEGLAKAEKNSHGFTDLKTQRFMSLGQTTWQDAAVRTVSEPGLSRGRALGRQGVTIGGWAEMDPVQVLKNTGCEKVIYLTRQGDDFPGAKAIGGVLGMTEDESERWFSLQKKSVATDALELADAVWCTNWEGDFETPKDLYEDAWSSPVYMKKDFYTPKDPRLIHAQQSFNGCVPFMPPTNDRTVAIHARE